MTTNGIPTTGSEYIDTMFDDDAPCCDDHHHHPTKKESTMTTTKPRKSGKPTSAAASIRRSATLATPAHYPATTPIERFDWVANGLVERLLTCRNHPSGLWMTKNPSTRTLHFLRAPIGHSWECACPFSDLVVITDPEHIVGQEFNLDVFEDGSDEPLLFRIDPHLEGGACEPCEDVDHWSRATVIGRCVSEGQWYGHGMAMCGGCAQWYLEDEKRKQRCDATLITGPSHDRTELGCDLPRGHDGQHRQNDAYGRDSGVDLVWDRSGHVTPITNNSN